MTARGQGSRRTHSPLTGLRPVPSGLPGLPRVNLEYSWGYKGLGLCITREELLPSRDTNGMGPCEPMGPTVFSGGLGSLFRFFQTQPQGYPDLPVSASPYTPAQSAFGAEATFSC